MLRWLINLLIILILVLFQTSIFSVLPFLASINFVLLFIIYLTIRGEDSFLLVAIIGGYLLDLYSSYTFGTHILTILIITFFSKYIYFNVLTNHRFFPIIILIILNIILYHSIFLLTVFGLNFLKLLPMIETINSVAIKNIGVEIVYTVVFISILYFLFYITKKNLKSMFLSAPTAAKKF